MPSQSGLATPYKLQRKKPTSNFQRACHRLRGLSTLKISGGQWKISVGGAEVLGENHGEKKHSTGQSLLSPCPNGHFGCTHPIDKLPSGWEKVPLQSLAKGGGSSADLHEPFVKGKNVRNHGFSHEKQWQVLYFSSLKPSH